MLNEEMARFFFRTLIQQPPFLRDIPGDCSRKILVHIELIRRDNNDVLGKSQVIYRTGHFYHHFDAIFSFRIFRNNKKVYVAVSVRSPARVGSEQDNALGMKPVHQSLGCFLYFLLADHFK